MTAPVLALSGFFSDSLLDGTTVHDDEGGGVWPRKAGLGQRPNIVIRTLRGLPLGAHMCMHCCPVPLCLAARRSSRGSIRPLFVQMIARSTCTSPASVLCDVNPSEVLSSKCISGWCRVMSPCMICWTAWLRHACTIQVSPAQGNGITCPYTAVLLLGLRMPDYPLHGSLLSMPPV